MPVVFLILAEGPDSAGATPYLIHEVDSQFVEGSLGLSDTLFISGGYAFLSRTYRQIPLDTSLVMPLGAYMKYAADSTSRAWLVEKLLEETKEQSQENQGLIPDVEIPVSMPSNLAFLGEGGKIEIDGRNSITLGGRGDYPLGYTRPGYEYGSPFSLEMDQTMQIRLTGTVGQKIKVQIDHDSERQDQSKNKVVLKYEGDEDEVVQLLEAGDTKAEFPSTQYASFPGGSKGGLFGVKGVFKLGGLKTTVLAVRDKGSRQSKTFTGGAEVRVETLWVDQFVRRKFYKLGLGPNDTVISLILFLDDANQANNRAKNAKFGIIAYNADTTSELREEGYFHQLWENQDYYWLRKGVIELASALSEGQRLGAYMVVVNTQTGDTTVYGDISGDTLVLKMIAPANLPRQIDPRTVGQDTLEVWNYELKNVYQLYSASMAHSPPQVRIFRETGQGEANPDGEGGKTYAQILGLDPDGDGYIQEVQIIDGVAYKLVDYRKGYIIFPSETPFMSDALAEPDSLPYFKIPLDPSDERKYYMVVEYTEKVDQIFLGTDILEGSVIVKVNGETLKEGTDYTVDYNSGILTILNEEKFADPNATVEISYDVIPSFALTKRSVLGLRADYELSDNVSFGSSLIMSSEATMDLRPSITEAPKRAAVAEADVQAEFFYDWLTRAVDRLPLVRTDAESKLSLQAEAARAFPNPNTAGEGYLDDMESIETSVDLKGSGYATWSYGSIPPGKDTSGFVQKIIWYNPRQEFRRGEVYPNLPEEEANDYQTDILKIYLWPNTSDPEANWASLMHLLSQSGIDLSTSEFLEVYVRGDGLKLHVDIGYDIPEDAPRRDASGKIRGLDTLNTEDLDSNFVFNSATEDVGLDGVAGADSEWHEGSPDDGNDDYSFSDLNRANGSEGNGRWDTEDLDKNGVLNTQENYFSYTIDLDTTQPLYTYNGWKYYKIPLRDSTRYEKFGNPYFDAVRYVRVWFDGFSEPETLWIADMRVTGNQWFSLGTEADSSALPINSPERFRTSYVNNEDNGAYYSPPPGAKIREESPGYFEREGSLALIYENLLPAHTGIAKRGLTSKISLLDYKEIAFWVKPHPETQPPYPVVVFRMGTDSLNYYEFRYQVSSADWVEVRFSLDSLTRFKKAVLDTTSDSAGYHREGSFAFRGNPNLSQISFLWFGIYNPHPERISGEVWVDELRAVGPRTDGGAAYRVKASLNAADLLSLDAQASREEADFQGLSDASKRTSTSSRADYSATLNLDKFFPKAWGLKIPFTYRGSSSLDLPKYSVSGDVLLEPHERLKERSISGSNSYSVQFSQTGAHGRWAKWFVQPFRLQASRNTSYNIGPVSITKADQRSFSGTYSYNPRIKEPPKIFGKQIRYLPSSYSLSYTLTDNWDYSYQRVSGTETESYKTQGRASGNISWAPINNINLRYSLSKEFDYLADSLLEGGGSGNQVRKSKKPKGHPSWSLTRWWEAGHDEDVSASWNFALFRGFFTPRVNWSARYSEDHSASKQSRDSLGNLVDIRDVSANTSTDFKLGTRLLGSILRVISKVEPVDTSGREGPLRQLAKGWGTTTLGYRFQRDASFPALYGRPDPAFRYGFTQDPGWGSANPLEWRVTETNTFSLSQGLNFARLSVRSNWELSYTYNQNPTQPTWSKNLTNPNLSVNLSDIKFLFPKDFSKRITSASLNSSFSQRFSWTEALPEREPMNRSVETNFSPLLQLNLTVRSGPSISLSRNWRTSTTDAFGATPTRTVSQTGDWSLRVSQTIQNFGGFRLPGREGKILKLESELRLSFNLSISDNTQTTAYWDEIYDTWSEPELTSSTYTKSWSFEASYKFSASVTGSLTYSEDMNLNRMTNTGYKTNKLLFTVNFVF